MEITLVRSLEIAPHIEGIREHLNAITEEDLLGLISVGNSEEALGPMLDPTRWRDEGLFDATRQTKKVLQALLDFKRAVKGIGKFI